MSERNPRCKDGNNSRSSGGGSLRRKDKSVDQTNANREASSVWSPKNYEILLELVNDELKAKGYMIRLPDNPGKRRVEEKFFEITGVRVKWEPEIKSRVDYMRKLRQYNSILINRTGVTTNNITGKIEMPECWWTDRIAEFGKNGKFVRILQSKPLPFKDILDQIFGEHDLEQDDRYSPHTLRTHIQHTLDDEVSEDDIEMDEGPEENGSQFPLDVSSDDEFPRASQASLTGTREQVRISPSRTSKSNLHVRKTTTRRTNRKRINFESQVQTGFERLEESRTSLLDVLRSRHNSKATFGDAIAVLETLPVEQMGKFWWEANKILMNDEDVRDGFMKLRSEDNKIQFLEKLTGVDRYGYPCDIINLRGTNSSASSSLPSTHSQMAGINASSSFCPGYGMFETGSSGTTFSSLLGGVTPNAIGETRYGTH